MPLVTYVCNNCDCKNKITKFFKPKQPIPTYLDCAACSIGKLERKLGAPASVSKISVDNGFNTRAVEMIEDIEKLNEERNNKDLTEDN